MFNSKSIYALNKKDPDAIVYTDADGTLMRLTRDAFTSEEEFQKWKAWSDEDYHGDEKDSHVYSNHATSITRLPEATVSAPSPETELENEHDKLEREQLCKLISEGLDSCLTPTQKRRLLLYVINSKTLDEIALSEGVSHQAVSKSINATKEKMKKFLKNRVAKHLF